MYRDTKALIIGMGLSGRSAARFLIEKGACVYGVDKKADLLKEHPDLVAMGNAFFLLNEDECPPMELFDLAVLSPGISMNHPLAMQAVAKGVELIGEIALGCRHAVQPLIGITGTNGKTTVTLLVSHVLNASGYPARALGNVGQPFTQELLHTKEKDILVLELSSYQLEMLKGAYFEQGIVLNITPDHLDRYASMDEYAAAKLRLEGCMKAGGTLWVEEKYQEHLPAAKVYGYSQGCSLFTDLQSLFFEKNEVLKLPSSLQGKPSHALENFMAAFALCSGRGVAPQQFLKGWETFKTPPHRIEFVMEREGIRYYDDSKGTNIDAVVRAVESIEGLIVLIAGGVDKGASYSPWIEAFKNKVKCICAIGQAAGKIESQLAPIIPVISLASLEEAVNQAASLAQEGEAVLLSPGCASFDMFKDYAHRGEEFQRLVRRGLQCQEKIQY